MRWTRNLAYDAPDDVIADARAFISGTTWTFATTMADNPHWYVVVPDEPDVRIDALLTLLNGYSIVRRWHRRPYRIISLDGWDYWDIAPVINRKPTAHAGWDGDPTPVRGWLPDDFYRDIRGDERLFLLESDHWGVDPDSGVEA